MEEILIRTLDRGALTPLSAYAALRAKAPNRTSFLLDAPATGEQGEQSVIGFLVKSESAYPASVDALAALTQAAAQMPAPDGSPEAAASCVRDMIALLMFDAVLAGIGTAPWPDQSFVGREVSDLASVTFNHAEGTLTIAAKNANVVERMARVLGEAQGLPPLAPGEGALPEHMMEHPPAPAFTKQYSRAQRRLALGGLSRLLLHRTFSSSVRNAEPLDVHRALAEAAPHRHRFFLELAASPVFPRYVVTGTARPAGRLGREGGAQALGKDLQALFSLEEGCGAPAKEAVAAWRDIGVGPLAMRGGAILRIRPGGVVEAMVTETHVEMHSEQLHTVGAAEVLEGRDVAGHLAAAQEDAAAALAAIRRAQDAAAARDAAREAASE